MNMAGMEVETDLMNAGDDMNMEVTGMNAGEVIAGTDMANGGEMSSGATIEMNETNMAGELSGGQNSESNPPNEGQDREGMDAELHQLQEKWTA